MESENRKLDQKAEPDKQKVILNLIERHISRTYFKESKLPAFFAKCWELEDPKAFKEGS